MQIDPASVSDEEAVRLVREATDRLLSKNYDHPAVVRVDSAGVLSVEHDRWERGRRKTSHTVSICPDKLRAALAMTGGDLVIDGIVVLDAAYSHWIVEGSVLRVTGVARGFQCCELVTHLAIRLPGIEDPNAWVCARTNRSLRTAINRRPGLIAHWEAERAMRAEERELRRLRVETQEREAAPKISDDDSNALLSLAD